MQTVAVLPFTTQGNDPQQIDLARSLTREVSAYLSTFPGAHTLAIPAIWRPSSPSESWRNNPGPHMPSMATWRKSAERIGVSVCLTDASTGESLWSDHYDFEGSDRLLR